jgi:hypothetical protein
MHELNRQASFMQALILLWADCSGVIRFTALRRPGARQILYESMLKTLGTWAGPSWSRISRHRPLTILDDGRATERLAKARGLINAAAACHRIVKRRRTLARCAMRRGGVQHPSA